MAFIKYAVFILIFACSVMFIRKQLAPKLEFHVGGHVEPGFEAVKQAFGVVIKERMYGGAFAAYYKGKPVVDLWGGYADVESKQLWVENTITQSFSTTKGLAAVCVAVLVSRGLVSYDDPVSKFWPEFAQNGKEKITLRTLMNHQAGLCALDEVLTLKDIRTDSPKVERVLAAQKPHWEPGTATGYHMLTIGLYADQVVRHVDPKRRSIAQFFKDEIAEPLGLDFSLYLKLEDFHRNARLIELADYGFWNSVFNAIETWDFGIVPVFWEHMTNPEGIVVKSGFSVKTHQSFNHFENKVTPLASVSGHGAARALAKLFGIIAKGDAVVGGKPLIRKEIIQDIVKIPEQVPTDVILKSPVIFSLGFLSLPGPTGDFHFGSPGYGGQMAYGDPVKQVGWSLLTNHIQIYMVRSDPRIQILSSALYECIEKLEESVVPSPNNR